MCLNKHLLNDLIKRNLWNDQLRQKLLATNGSVQNIDEVPSELKSLYKTVWEIPQKTLVDLALARGPFIDQSQSLNVYFESPTFSKLSSLHF